MTGRNWKSRRLWLAVGGGAALALAIFFYFRGRSLSADEWAQQAPTQLRTLLESGAAEIGAVKSVTRFYSSRDFKPAWVEPSSFKKELVPFSEKLHAVSQDGLQPADYHAARITQLRKKLSSSGRKAAQAMELAELDLLLTDAYLLLATHYTVGKANPDLVDTGGGGKVKHLLLTEALNGALTSNTVLASLERRQRPEPAFQNLRKALDRYIEIAANGGWPVIPEGPDLKAGAEAERVGVLKRRLVVTGELSKKEIGTDNRFDEALTPALMRFQESHGLKADGVLNAATLAQLNVPVQERIAQIQVNLERWRWIPRVMADRYLLVNTANFKVSLYENGKPALELRSIIGKFENETPMFSDEMTYLVVNPAWNIPRSIAVEEMLPKVKRNPAYLAKSKIDVQRIVGGKPESVDPGTVQWGSLTETNFNLLLRQAPGPGNPLGPLKFVFPNSHDVYLHGTPNQKLFNKTVRAFSHGCIRIENPLALAEALLKGSPEWNREKLLSAIKHEKNLTIPLPQPIPVHIYYWTAWVADSGVLQFRPDVYGWDRPLHKTLGEKVATTTRLAD